MNNHTKNNINRSLRFKRWSRKGDAVFMSIGRAVSIGKLAADIEVSSEAKAIFGRVEAGRDSFEEDFSDDILQSDEELLLALCIEGSNSCEECCSRPQWSIIKSMRTHYFCGFGGLQKK